MLLFRKIDETRWFDRKPLESVSITELNALDNELSVWEQDDKVKELDLGLAFILTQRVFRDIWCVKIPDEVLAAKGLQLRQEDSSTPYIAMRSYHTNVKVPTVKELSIFASLLHDLIQDTDNNCRFFSETDLKIHFYNVLVTNAIEIDFTAWTNLEKWKAIKEIQQTLGTIDFSKLDNVVPRKK